MTRTDPLETATVLGFNAGRIMGKSSMMLLQAYQQALKEGTNMPVTNELPATHVNDIVVFIEDFNLSARDEFRAPKGSVAVVADEHQASPDVTLVHTGRCITVPRTVIRHQEGAWVNLSGHLSAVKVGESLVRPKTTVYGQDTYVRHGVHVARGSGAGTVALKPRNRATLDYLPATDFELWQPATQEQRAMATVTALEFLKKFADLGVAVGIRSRSWDKQGRFAAIETYKQDGKKNETLYTPAQCEAALLREEQAQPAIDLIAVTSGLHFRFTTPTGALTAPDGTDRWSLGEIQRCKGIVRQGGKKYRLCTEEVIRRTVPIVAGS